MRESAMLSMVKVDLKVTDLKDKLFDWLTQHTKLNRFIKTERWITCVMSKNEMVFNRCIILKFYKT